MTDIKICGITHEDTLAQAEEAGARFAGFVFYPPSPRNLTLERAQALAGRTKLEKVALFVDPDDSVLEMVRLLVKPDFLQLHGRETPERTAMIGRKFGIPVIKALGIGSVRDVEGLKAYDSACAWFLLDSSPRAAQAGGTGQRFEWSLLQGVAIEKPWMLAGGLTPENVTEAICALKPTAVDVSSGVESGRGRKDPEKIARFAQAVKDARFRDRK